MITQPTIRRLFLLLVYFALTTPLWVSAAFLFPFITMKVLLFTGTVLGLLGLFVVGVMFTQGPIRIRISVLHLVLIGYLLVVLVSSLVGLDLSRSIWGTLERGWGGFLLFTLALFFFLASQVLQEEEWPRLFGFSVLVSIIASIIGYLQWQGISVFNYSVSGRVVGPIGNASLFAAYLLVHLFLTGWLFFRTRTPRIRWLLLAAAVFQFLVLFLTETRGAIVAFFSGALVLLVLQLWVAKHRTLRWLTIGGLGGLLLLVGGFFALKDSPLVARIPALYRLSTISPTRDISSEYRILSWKAAWEGFKERPILGWGYENYYRVFDKYFPPKIFYDEGSQVWSDRAHNAYVDAAVMSGGLGLAFFLGVFLAGFLILFRGFRRGTFDRVTAVFFAALLVGYLVQHLFGFEALSGAVPFFLVLAFLGAAVPAREFRFPKLGLAVLFVLLFFGFLIGGLRPAFASSKIARVFEAEVQGKPFHEILEAARTGLRSRGWERFELRQAFANLLLGLSLRERNSLTPEVRDESVKLLEEGFEESIQARPHEVRNYLYLMRLFNAFPQALPDAPKRVRALGEEARALSPTRMETYWEIGASFLAEEHPRDAVPYFEKALSLYTFPPVSHWNLMYAYLRAGDEEAAQREEAYLKTLDFSRGRVDALYTIGVEYFWKRDFSRARQYLERVYAENSEFRDTASYLLTMYQESGENEKLGRLLKGETLNPKP